MTRLPLTLPGLEDRAVTLRPAGFVAGAKLFVGESPAPPPLSLSQTAAAISRPPEAASSAPGCASQSHQACRPVELR